MEVTEDEMELLEVLTKPGFRLRKHSHIEHYAVILKDRGLKGVEEGKAGLFTVPINTLNSLLEKTYIKFHEGVSVKDYLISKKGRELVKSKS